MLKLLWLIPALPFATFLSLVLFGARIPKKAVAAIGVSLTGVSAMIAFVIGIDFMAAPPPGHAYSQTLWTWIQIDGFRPDVALYLDALSLVMTLIVTFVGFLILLYSTEFMVEEKGYSRFFAYMNLFIGSMLTLVLAENLLLLYLGWEGVGLCSYLLIGFWYEDPANGRAAMKAFIVTRIGDAAMALGLFLLFYGLGTLQIQELMQKASQQWTAGSPAAMAGAALLLAGALGKSAQLPLQTWLPDAMAGPTPVSALIHAATMVTAGVYLIARTNVIFSLAPVVQSAVAVIGALTLLISGLSALAQRDIKRVLAYSTISQIGYMFLALGVGAWSAAIFHFVTHAFFKALLFLGAGAVIHALDHEHDMFKMGGLRKKLPVTFVTFLIGSASLSALPLVTAGFYSKDMILWHSLSSPGGNVLLWAAGLAGAFITSIYTFRMVFLVFFGKARTKVVKKPGPAMSIPLIILGALSIAGGFMELPGPLGDLPVFSNFISSALPAARTFHHGAGYEVFALFVSAVASLSGIYIAYIFFYGRRHFVENILKIPGGETLRRFFLSGFGFDWMYEKAFIAPFLWMARANKDDFIDLFYDGIAWYNRFFHRGLTLTQSGKVRWYAVGITLGAVIVIGMAAIL